MAARKSSIETNSPARSTCQKVQPLHAGKPWTSAPILWIEPTAGPSVSAPSARARAPWRPFESTSRSPGWISPASMTLAKATRGSLRGGRDRSDRVRLDRNDRVDARARRGGISRVALQPDERSGAETARDGAGGA